MTGLRIRGVTVFAISALCIAANARAEDPKPEDIVKYRQAAMKSQREHLAAAAAIAEGKVPYTAHLGEHAAALAATAKRIPELFPAATGSGDGNALARVWVDTAEFEARAADNARKAAALLQAASAKQMADMPARVRELLDSCKACHKDFRKPLK